MTPDDSAPTPALLPPEQSIATLAREIHRAFARLLGHRLAQFEVTASMWSYLFTLWREDGLTLRELARRINLEGPTVGAAVLVMEKRGLVVRKRNAADRREWRVHLTQRGRDLRPVLLEIGGRLNDDAVAELGREETLRLVRSLQQVKRTMEDLMARLPIEDD